MQHSLSAPGRTRTYASPNYEFGALTDLATGTSPYLISNPKNVPRRKHKIPIVV